jgi:hypothetical protein
MIFSSIIALFFGFLLVSFGLVLVAKLGTVGVGLVIGVFAFLGSQRLAHGKSVGETIAGAVCTLLPIWGMPWCMESDMQTAAVWPTLAILSLAILLGVGVTALMERKKG